MSIDFSNLYSVKGKTVVITGGSRGIGEMLAAGFGVTKYSSVQ